MVNKRRTMRRLLPGGGCLLCEATAAGLICRDCRMDLPRVITACELCARPLPGDGICPRCLRRPPPYRARATCRYEYPVPALVQKLKFRGQTGLGAEIAALMLEQGAGADLTESCLLPMPLHWRRQLARGFNQALEIARPLASHLGIPLATDLCRRAKATRPQADLRGRRRRENVSGAFRLRKAGGLAPHVIVVDDVMTSGHTAAALARCLRRAGARSVTVWAFARAGLRRMEQE